MSFKTRERKRRKKAAMQSAQTTSRATGSSSNKWWLTPVKTDTCCARCRGILRIGRAMVYRHTPREALCQSCADNLGIYYRPSRAWEAGQR